MPLIPPATAECLAKRVASIGSASGGSLEAPVPAAAEQAAAASSVHEQAAAPTKWGDSVFEGDFVDPEDDTLWPLDEASGPGQDEALVTAAEVARLIVPDDISSFGGSTVGLTAQEETSASGQHPASNAGGGADALTPNVDGQWVSGSTSARGPPPSTGKWLLYGAILMLILFLEVEVKSESDIVNEQYFLLVGANCYVGKCPRKNHQVGLQLQVVLEDLHLQGKFHQQVPVTRAGRAGHSERLHFSMPSECTVRMCVSPYTHHRQEASNHFRSLILLILRYTEMASGQFPMLWKFRSFSVFCFFFHGKWPFSKLLLAKWQEAQLPEVFAEQGRLIPRCLPSKVGFIRGVCRARSAPQSSRNAP